MVPPIPPLPPDARRHNAEFYPSNVEQPPLISSRIVSVSTVFDDDEDLDAIKRPGTGESQLRILTKQASFDSIASRHRSKGWWDHIVTPFWPRSPMTFKASSSPIPVLQITRRAAEVNLSRDRATSPMVSPQTLEHEGIASGHTSRTAMSLEAEWEK